MDRPATPPLYRFGKFELDIARRALRARADDRALPVTSRALDTLICLVQRAGELVDKSVLMKEVWPDVLVEENNLQQNVTLLRRLLGEAPGEHRYIATVPGRGYRFVADVTVTRAAASTSEKIPAADDERPRIRAIAVLPFANLTGDPTKEYLASGICEELIHTLARVHGLKVAASTSSSAYARRRVDVRQVASDLGVDAVIEGNLRDAGDCIHISAQLIDGRTGFHIWSYGFDATLQNLFSVRAQLAVAVSEALRIGADAMQAALLEKAPTHDLTAYQLYLQAKAEYSRPHLQSAKHAVELLSQARERDPQFARAHALSAAVRLHFVYFDACAAEHLAEAEREIDSALALEDDLAVAHATRGMLMALRGDRLGAEAEFQVALTLDDNDPSTRMLHSMGVLTPAGHLSKARQELLRCHQIAPALTTAVLNLALLYLYTGDDANSERYANLAVERGLPPSSPQLADVHARLAARAGDNEQAARRYKEDLPIALQGTEAADVIDEVFAASPDPGKRSQAAARLTALISALEPLKLDQTFRKRVVCWYTALGELDSAFAFVNASLDHIERIGTVPMGWVIWWLPEMAPFRRDPRFQSIAARLRLNEFWKVHGRPDVM